MGDKDKTDKDAVPADTSKYWVLAVTDRGVAVWSFYYAKECAEKFAAVKQDDSSAQVYVFFGKKLDVGVGQYTSVDISDPNDDKFSTKHDIRVET